MPAFTHHVDCPVRVYPDTGVCSCHQHMYAYQMDVMRTAQDEPDLEMLAASLLCGEAGEVMSVVHKERYQGHPRDDGKLLEECGDVLWAVTALLVSRGFNLSDAAKFNMEKRKLRYPEGFNTARSILRVDVKRQTD